MPEVWTQKPVSELHCGERFRFRGAEYVCFSAVNFLGMSSWVVTAQSSANSRIVMAVVLPEGFRLAVSSFSPLFELDRLSLTETEVLAGEA